MPLSFVFALVLLLRISPIVQSFDTGWIQTMAGTGEAGSGGDGGPATSALLSSPAAVWAGEGNAMFIADTNNDVVRKVQAGVISTVMSTANLTRPTGVVAWAGSRLSALQQPQLFVSDARHIYRVRLDPHTLAEVGPVELLAGGPVLSNTANSIRALDAGMTPHALVVEPVPDSAPVAYTLYLTDAANSMVRMVNDTGFIYTLAGTGAQNWFGDGGPAALAALHAPHGLARDRAGNIYVADTENHVIRRIDTTGLIDTVVGVIGAQGNGDDGLLATETRLSFPTAVVLNERAEGIYLFIADTGNDRVRMCLPNGTVTTVAGAGTSNASDAYSSMLLGPEGLFLTVGSALYIAETGGHRIRRVFGKPYYNFDACFLWNPCLNGGTCENTNVDDAPPFVCACAPPFSGGSCEFMDVSSSSAAVDGSSSSSSAPPRSSSSSSAAWSSSSSSGARSSSSSSRVALSSSSSSTAGYGMAPVVSIVGALSYVLAPTATVSLFCRVTPGAESPSTAGQLLYEWSETVRLTDLNYVGDGVGRLSARNSPTLVFRNPSGWTRGVTYRFRLNVTDLNTTRSAVVTIPVRIASPPAGGPCYASPSTGTALTTSFTLRCDNWDAGSVPSPPAPASAPGFSTQSQSMGEEDDHLLPSTSTDAFWRSRDERRMHVLHVNPIGYLFTLVDADTANEFPLAPALAPFIGTSASISGIRLPSGPQVIRVYVTDPRVVGLFTRVEFTVQVRADAVLTQSAYDPAVVSCYIYNRTRTTLRSAVTNLRQYDAFTTLSILAETFYNASRRLPASLADPLYTRVVPCPLPGLNTTFLTAQGTLWGLLVSTLVNVTDWSLAPTAATQFLVPLSSEDISIVAHLLASLTALPLPPAMHADAIAAQVWDPLKILPVTPMLTLLTKFIRLPGVTSALASPLASVASADMAGALVVAFSNILAAWLSAGEPFSCTQLDQVNALVEELQLAVAAGLLPDESAVAWNAPALAATIRRVFADEASTVGTVSFPPGATDQQAGSDGSRPTMDVSIIDMSTQYLNYAHCFPELPVSNVVKITVFVNGTRHRVRLQGDNNSEFVEFFIPIPQYYDNCGPQLPTCQYLDTDNTTWSSEGCTTVEVNVRLPDGKLGVKCRCTHLTDFALLLRDNDFETCHITTNAMLFVGFACVYAAIFLVSSIQFARLTYQLWLTGGEGSFRRGGSRMGFSCRACLSSLPELSALEYQHLLIAFVGLFRMLVALWYSQRAPGLKVVADVGLALILCAPYLAMFWSYSVLIFQWAFVVKNMQGSISGAFERLKPYYVTLNVIIVAALLSLFVSVAAQTDFDQRRKLAYAGSIVLASVYAGVAIGFLVYGGLISWTVYTVAKPVAASTQRGAQLRGSRAVVPRKSQFPFRIFSIVVVVSIGFIIEAIVTLVSVVDDTTFQTTTDELQGVFLVVDMVCLLSMLFLFFTSVENKIDMSATAPKRHATNSHDKDGSRQQLSFQDKNGSAQRLTNGSDHTQNNAYHSNGELRNTFSNGQSAGANTVRSNASDGVPSPLSPGSRDRDNSTSSHSLLPGVQFGASSADHRTVHERVQVLSSPNNGGVERGTLGNSRHEGRPRYESDSASQSRSLEVAAEPPLPQGAGHVGRTNSFHSQSTQNSQRERHGSGMEFKNQSTDNRPRSPSSSIVSYSTSSMPPAAPTRTPSSSNYSLPPLVPMRTPSQSIISPISTTSAPALPPRQNSRSQNQHDVLQRSEDAPPLPARSTSPSFSAGGPPLPPTRTGSASLVTRLPSGSTATPASPASPGADFRPPLPPRRTESSSLLTRAPSDSLSDRTITPLLHTAHNSSSSQLIPDHERVQPASPQPHDRPSLPLPRVPSQSIELDDGGVQPSQVTFLVDPQQ